MVVVVVVVAAAAAVAATRFCRCVAPGISELLLKHWRPLKVVQSLGPIDLSLSPKALDLKRQKKQIPESPATVKVLGCRT